jgi:hypothetical protein
MLILNVATFLVYPGVLSITNALREVTFKVDNYYSNLMVT